MIVLHALDAPYDIPGIGIRRGDVMYHLLSDVPGPAGTAELVTFVQRVGGRASWMQAPGTYREHFDIFGEWAEAARAAGAPEISGHAVAAILAHKRGVMADAATSVPALTSRQMRVVMELLASQYHLHQAQVQEVAGARAADLARQMIGGALAGKQIAVLAGSGFTGGVGLVAARHLHHAGAQVQIWLATESAHISGALATALEALHALGMAPQRDHLPDVAHLGRADLILDALLGAGSLGAPHGRGAAMIHAANAAARPILALALPSGVDPDEDGLHTPHIQATATLALGLPLRGLVLSRTQAALGDLWLADISIPRRLAKRVGARMGPIFAAAPLVRLAGVPLAGDVVQWRLADSATSENTETHLASEASLAKEWNRPEEDDAWAHL
jgi:hydroxyethylthiazole kinase-like uncharacterized protein yjeF